jgi:hypothetical protein
MSVVAVDGLLLLDGLPACPFCLETAGSRFCCQGQTPEAAEAVAESTDRALPTVHIRHPKEAA